MNKKQIEAKLLAELEMITKLNPKQPSGCEICVYKNIDTFCQKNRNIYFKGNSCMYFKK